MFSGFSASRRSQSRRKATTWRPATLPFLRSASHRYRLSWYSHWLFSESTAHTLVNFQSLSTKPSAVSWRSIWPDMVQPSTASNKRSSVVVPSALEVPCSRTWWRAFPTKSHS